MVSGVYLALMETMGERITKARKAVGKTQADIARHFDISRNAVSAWESDISKPTGAKIGELAKLLNTTPDYLYGSEDESSPHSAVSTSPSPPELPYLDISLPDRQSMPLDIPVMGTVIGGNGGTFVYEGGVVDYVRRLPGVAKAKGIFALRVVGESMVPAYKEGALIVLNPHLPPRIGDDIVIEFAPNEAGEHVQGCLKQLVKRTASKIIVRQYNPPKEIEFETSTVKAIYRVMTLDELMGI